MLSSCCLGKNNVSEVICASIIPLTTVFEVLSDGKLPTFFRMPYILFFDETFIRTERNYDIVGHKAFWDGVLVAFAQDIEKANELSRQFNEQPTQ